MLCGHWLPCLLPAKFKMVNVAVTLILLLSCIHTPSPIFFSPEFSFKQQTNPFSFSKYFVRNGQSDILWLPNPLLSMFREFPSLRKYLFFPLYSCLMYTSSQKHKCILGGLCMLVLQSGCACKKKFCARILTFPFGSCFSLLLSNMSDEKPQRPEGQIFSLFSSLNMLHT